MAQFCFGTYKPRQHQTTLTHPQFMPPTILSSDGKTLVASDNGDLLLWDIGHF